jgi:hypothetical protein
MYFSYLLDISTCFNPYSKKEEISLDSMSLKTEDAEHTTQGKATAKEKTSSKLS